MSLRRARARRELSLPGRGGREEAEAGAATGILMDPLACLTAVDASVAHGLSRIEAVTDDRGETGWGSQVRGVRMATTRVRYSTSRCFGQAG